MSPTRKPPRNRRRFWHRYALVETTDVLPISWIKSLHITRYGAARALGERVRTLTLLHAVHVDVQVVSTRDPLAREAIPMRPAGALWRRG